MGPPVTTPERPEYADQRYQAGDHLGPYTIVDQIGAGGMGRVYKAFDPRLGRDVAIKVAVERFSERFEREARAVAALNHPNICTVYDVGADFLVLELVEGRTLREALARPLPLDQSITIARQVLEALAAAHRAGIVHRDLKPDNVMVRADGYVKVLDFGLAAWLPAMAPQGSAIATGPVTQAGQMLGTIEYMSPEQIQGQQADARSDLFAFGVMLYEMITHAHPWRRSSPVETLHAILHDDLPAVDAASPLTADLAAIVRALVRKHPAERYATAATALEALSAAVPAAGRSSAAGAAAPMPLRSVAILPFVFLSDVDDRRALSLGFADALITILGNLEDVFVAPTSAILGYEAGADPAAVCRDLRVRYTLQGTVQRIGLRWRVSMQMFDATTQKMALSEKHDFSLDNVFDVQDEIGRRTVESLQSRFPAAIATSRERYSSDPEAYNEFMTGLRESATDRQDMWLRAVEHLSRAVDIDPGFALAHATLSFVSMNLSFQFDAHHRWLQTAEDHCRHALTLDPTLPEGHLARAWILWSPAKNFQHAEAIAALEQVLTARPNLERAHNRMSTICSHIGRIAESRIAHERAQRANPKTRTGNLEYFYIYSGDFSRAEDCGAAWFRERPDNPYAVSVNVYTALLREDLDAAAQRLAAALIQLPDDSGLLAYQALLHARRRERDSALEYVRRALESPHSFGHTHHTHYTLACVHAELGETDKAMAWLERSADTGYPCWPFFRIDPYLKNVRAAPAFTRLVESLEQKYTALEIRKL